MTVNQQDAVGALIAGGSPKGPANPEVLLIGSDTATGVLLRLGCSPDAACFRVDTVPKALEMIGIPTLRLIILEPAKEDLAVTRLLRRWRSEQPDQMLWAIAGRQDQPFALDALSDLSPQRILVRPLHAGSLIEGTRRALGIQRLARGASGHDLVCRFYEYLAHHWQGFETNAAIARALGISASRLAHVVHGTTGRSLKQWQYQARIFVAQELLRTTTDKVEVIANLLGFADSSHFSRVFLRLTGVRPGAYRLHDAPK